MESKCRKNARPYHSNDIRQLDFFLNKRCGASLLYRLSLLSTMDEDGDQDDNTDEIV